MLRSCLVLSLLLVGVAVLLAPAGSAVPLQETEPAEEPAEEPVYSAFAGGMTFRTYCSNCHGNEGRGDGYIAETLKVPPADLTALTARNGGEYPADAVRAKIDGREEVRVHGRREMPIWGEILLWPEGDSPERQAHVRRKIGELVEYVRSIQEPSTTD